MKRIAFDTLFVTISVLCIAIFMEKYYHKTSVPLNYVSYLIIGNKNKPPKRSH